MIVNTTKSEETVTGLKKAAMLLDVLGEQASAELLQQLSEDDVQKVSREVAKITSISGEQAETVLNEFHHIATAGDYVARGGMEFARKLLMTAFTPDVAKRLLDRLSETHPKLVEELVPKLLSLGEVHKVLQQLLREQVSIRDLATILETLLDTAAVIKHPVLLVEAARQALGRALVRPLLEENNLRVVTLDSTIEEELGRAFSPSASPTATAGLQPSLVRRILDGLRRLAGEQVAVASPVLLCSTPARFHLKRLLEPFVPKLVVLSPSEIPPVVSVQSVGVVR